MPSQRNLNLNNNQAQQVYSGETPYPTFVVEIQEINLWSERDLPNNQPSYPPKDIEKEKEDSRPQVNPPPFLERLIHSSQHILEETELLGELKNMCVKIPSSNLLRILPSKISLSKRNVSNTLGG